MVYVSFEDERELAWVGLVGLHERLLKQKKKTGKGGCSLGYNLF